MKSKNDARQAASGPVSTAAPAQPGIAAPRGRARWLALAALLSGMILGGLGGRYWFKDQAMHQYDTLKQQLEGELIGARAELAKAQAHVDALNGNLMVEESTRKGLEASLEATQAELGRTRDQLAFFDQLFPPGPKGAVSIRAFEAQILGSNVQYRALFMRNAVNAPTFKGRMQFVAQGKRDGKQVRITLEPARGATPRDAGSPQAPAGSASPAASGVAEDGGFALQFDEFQRSVGLLSLPADFAPDKLILNVLEGDAVRATRSVSIDTGESAP